MRKFHVPALSFNPELSFYYFKSFVEAEDVFQLFITDDLLQVLALDEMKCQHARRLAEVVTTSESKDFIIAESKIK